MNLFFWHIVVNSNLYQRKIVLGNLRNLRNYLTTNWVNAWTGWVFRWWPQVNTYLSVSVIIGSVSSTGNKFPISCKGTLQPRNQQLLRPHMQETNTLEPLIQPQHSQERNVQDFEAGFTALISAIPSFSCPLWWSTKRWSTFPIRLF